MLVRAVSISAGMPHRSHSLMIQESAVLLGVEHFEEGTGRIAIYTLSDLVDFIDKDQGVLDTNAFKGLDNLPR